MGNEAVWRWVQSPLHARDLDARAVHDPDVREDCKGWGLSVYRTREIAESELRRVTAPPAWKRKRSQAVMLALRPGDGLLCGDPDGHMTLFESASANLYGRAAEVQAVPMCL